ncbi:MAG TPA: hypothetical protein PLX89_07710 [Verrucomicrobiota bacterium]|nr:hypothetical protein [Verrucomicrobiales bacterium]HRI12875.1 hypothetical protein [Verrucomicrobiota bacterium]
MEITKTTDEADVIAENSRLTADVARLTSELATANAELAKLRAKDMDADLRAAKIVAAAGIVGHRAAEPARATDSKLSFTEQCRLANATAAK